MKKLFHTRLFDDAADPVSEPVEETPPQEDKVAELEAANMRLRADIANMQRRALEDSRRMSQEGTKRLLDQLLPSLDALDFAMQALPEDIASHPWTEGLRQFEKLLQKTLTEAGLRKIEVKAGKTPFDPQMHEAIGSTASEEMEPGTVSQVYQNGYSYQGVVLRTAKVQVVA